MVSVRYRDGGTRPPVPRTRSRFHTFVGGALTELVVHGWDLATATGQPFDLPAHTLEACFEQVAALVPNAPLPDLWGPPVEIRPDAALLVRIVAATGRAP